LIKYALAEAIVTQVLNEISARCCVAISAFSVKLDGFQMRLLVGCKRLGH
jgi:hypothetical protein